MAYAEVSVIVDGALDEEATFYDETLMNDWLHHLKDESIGHGYPTEVYVRYHEHELSECECAQYETDHNPAYKWNVDDS